MSKCPECGSSRSKEAPMRQGEIFVIVRDRICKECDARYRPPTPKWAPFGLLIAGAAVLCGGGALALGVLSGGMAQQRMQALVVVPILIGFGAALLVYGVRMLLSPSSREQGLTVSIDANRNIRAQPDAPVDTDSPRSRTR